MFGAPNPSREDARVLGVQLPEPAPFGLWVRYEQLCILMQHAPHQWRLGAMGGVVGMDMLAVKAVAEALEISWGKQLVCQLVQFEAMVLKILRKDQKS